MTAAESADFPVVVLGAGLMGSQIGIEFASRGYSVSLLARRRSDAEHRLTQTAGWAVDLGLLTRDDGAASIARTRVETDIAALPDRASVLLESLPEDLDVKVDVLRRASEQVRTTIVGTNTASLSIGAIGHAIGMPLETVGMHYWNPPMLMPLVEVTPSDASSAATVEGASALLQGIGKTVIRVRRDVPGFVWNRLQFAVLREALWLLDEGVVTMEDLDTVMRLGLARRWQDVGLFESIVLGGPANWERVATHLFPVLATTSSAAGLAQRVRNEGGRRDGLKARRDRGLAGSAQERDAAP